MPAQRRRAEGAGDSAEAALAWLSAAEADLVGERFEEADGAARRAAVMLQARTAPASRRWPRASRSPPAPVPVTGTRTTWSWRRRWHDGWRTRGTCSARRRLRLTAVRLAIAAGLLDRASAELGRAEAPPAAPAPTPTLVTAWWCRALLRRARGDDRGADAVARAVLRLLDRSRASLGALDLRTGLATHALAVARLGMELALESGSARRVLQWVGLDPVEGAGVRTRPAPAGPGARRRAGPAPGRDGAAARRRARRRADRRPPPRAAPPAGAAGPAVADGSGRRHEQPGRRRDRRRRAGCRVGARSPGSAASSTGGSSSRRCPTAAGSTPSSSDGAGTGSSTVPHWTA